MITEDHEFCIARLKFLIKNFWKKILELVEHYNKIILETIEELTTTNHYIPLYAVISKS